MNILDIYSMVIIYIYSNVYNECNELYERSE